MAKKAAPKKEDKQEIEKVVIEAAPVKSEMEILAESLENIVSKSKELAGLAKAHAELCSKSGKHPGRYNYMSSQLLAKARQYQKDVVVLRRVI